MWFNIQGLESIMMRSLPDHGLPLVQLKEQRRDLVVALQNRNGPVSGWKLIWKRRRRRFRLASCGLPFIPIRSIHSALARVLRNAPSDLIRRVIAGANMNRYKT